MGPLSPRRIRADVAVVSTSSGGSGAGGAPGGGGNSRAAAMAAAAAGGGSSSGSSGRVTSDAFRVTLVEMVGAHHDVFVRKLGLEHATDGKGEGAGWGGGGSGRAGEGGSGRVSSWHPQFDLERDVPDPPLAPVSGVSPCNQTMTSAVARGGTTRREGVSAAGGGAAAASPVSSSPAPSSSPASSAAAAAAPGAGGGAYSGLTAAGRAGNGNAISVNWRRTVLDAADVRGDAITEAIVSDMDAAAHARDVLGESGSDLPVAAVAAVMKRAAVARHESDPAVLAERRRRRLCDLLPALFDTVRSLFATSKRRVCPFPELLRHVLRATTRQSSSPVETEEALRLLAASTPEWCELLSAKMTVSGEELWRVNSQEFTVTRFVREKLVAMKQDKL